MTMLIQNKSESLNLPKVSSFERTLEKGDLGVNLTDPSVFAHAMTKLYTQPLIAAMRETISNGIDALAKVDTDGFDADNPGLVISLTDPNTEKSSRTETEEYFLGEVGSEDDVQLRPLIFSVTDYGTGMTNEQIRDNFLSYKASTKESDLSVTGSKGIGAKAPLAFTDEMFITSTKNGEVNKYRAHRSAAGYEWSHLTSEKTDAPNGTTISFAIPVTEGELATHREYLKGIAPRISFSYGNSYRSTLSSDGYYQSDIFKAAKLIAQYASVLTDDWAVVETDLIIRPKSETEIVRFKENPVAVQSYTEVGQYLFDESDLLFRVLRRDYTNASLIDHSQVNVGYMISGYLYYGHLDHYGDKFLTAEGMTRNHLPDLIIELPYGIVDFPESRDAIENNKRFRTLENLVLLNLQNNKKLRFDLIEADVNALRRASQFDERYVVRQLNHNAMHSVHAISGELKPHSADYSRFVKLNEKIIEKDSEVTGSFILMNSETTDSNIGVLARLSDATQRRMREYPQANASLSSLNKKFKEKLYIGPERLYNDINKNLPRAFVHADGDVEVFEKLLTKYKKVLGIIHHEASASDMQILISKDKPEDIIVEWSELITQTTVCDAQTILEGIAEDEKHNRRKAAAASAATTTSDDKPKGVMTLEGYISSDGEEFKVNRSLPVTPEQIGKDYTDIILIPTGVEFGNISLTANSCKDRGLDLRKVLVVVPRTHATELGKLLRVIKKSQDVNLFFHTEENYDINSKNRKALVEYFFEHGSPINSSGRSVHPVSTSAITNLTEAVRAAVEASMVNVTKGGFNGWIDHGNKHFTWRANNVPARLMKYAEEDYGKLNLKLGVEGTFGIGEKKFEAFSQKADDLLKPLRREAASLILAALQAAHGDDTELPEVDDVCDPNLEVNRTYASSEWIPTFIADGDENALEEILIRTKLIEQMITPLLSTPVETKDLIVIMGSIDIPVGIQAPRPDGVIKWDSYSQAVRHTCADDYTPNRHRMDVFENTLRNRLSASYNAALFDLLEETLA